MTVDGGGSEPDAPKGEEIEDVDALRAHLAELTSRMVAMREQLVAAHAQLVGQDEEIERLAQELGEGLRRQDRMFEAKNDELDWRDRVIADLQARLAAADVALADAEREIAAMRQTRVWRAGERMWRLRSRVRKTG